MIDEKKIEEAAKECAENSGFITKDCYKVGFKAGINWFLDNLWHDASKCNDNNLDDSTLLLAEDIQRNWSLVTGYDVKTSKAFYTKILYLKDLLKGGK